MNITYANREFQALQTTTGLCAGVALEFLPPVNRCPAFDKDKYLEPMFGDVGQAQIKSWICRTVECYNLKLHLQKYPLLAAVYLSHLSNHQSYFMSRGIS